MAKSPVKKIQSIEPNIADLANGWLKSCGLDYKLEQESLNTEIDNALQAYFSKNGGTGANRPDAKLLLSHHQKHYPILIEYKGYGDKLVKLDSDGIVENRDDKSQPYFKNINSYAVNGAIHYANAILHHTSYSDVIAIGMTGEKDAQGNIQHQIGVYYVSKANLGAGQEVGKYDDFSFLSPENFPAFIEKVKLLNLSEAELAKLKAKREEEIDTSLTKLNNDIYKNESGLSESDRVYLVAAVIIATLGAEGVAPLEKADLTSKETVGFRDGDLIVATITAFLKARHLPDDKRDLIIRTLSNTLLTDKINKPEKGESQLKRVFTKIVDDLGFYYKIGLTTDFTGKLFNEMYSWLGFSQDKLNDVVLTPSYVATLLAKLARVNKDSYVWDFATGSAGLLVAAMNEMLNDAKVKITSPDELRKKEAQIKAEQLLGIEILHNVYMLAILNMILMGDGSSNVLNQDSLKDFKGNYGFGKKDEKFPADAFILNPPYSADGNGMVFVEKALNMMNKGYAAVIIQDSAGTGKAAAYNQRILKKHSLIASIKMPIDIFIGKSSVQTSIYVFKANEPHEADFDVKFIDFSDDGYKRASRKKAKASTNLRDENNALERYQEVVDLVKFGKKKLNHFTENDYVEDSICLPKDDSKEKTALQTAQTAFKTLEKALKAKDKDGYKENSDYKTALAAYQKAKQDYDNIQEHNAKVGCDWNFTQHKKINTKPTLADFKKTVADYLAWEVSQLLKQDDTQGK
ncbi:N-6 DNA methylase [Ursidibacter arcticus]